MHRSVTSRAGLTASVLIALAITPALTGCAPSDSSVITGSIGAPDAGTSPDATTPAIPGEGLEARMARLEYDLAELRLDYSIVRPDFERLVARETDLAGRIEALELASGPLTASFPSQRQEAASPRRDAIATAAGEGVGLHLASYRSRDRLVEGWNDLRAAHPAELGALTVRIQRIDTGEGGVFQRLVAGPVTSRTRADGLCRTLSARGVYCKTLPYTGDTLTP